MKRPPKTSAPGSQIRPAPPRSSRLETRGHIRHREEGPRYVFAPTTSPLAAARAALKQHVRTFFGGSFGTMATSLLREQKWTDEELEALHAEIEKARKERKKS